MLFTDRVDAGRRLAEAVRHLKEEKPVVLGLPRGGVPVAFEVARVLGAPLDVIVVRKLGVPYQPELGFGAIGEDGVRVLSEDIVRRAGIDPTQIATVEQEEEQELLRRARRYRDGRSRVRIEGRTVIVVDDGIATGATAAAACRVARAQGAARVVLAVPTAPPDTVHRLREAADDVVCLSTPHLFRAVGEWYQDFSQTSDEEVVSLLAQAANTANTANTRPSGRANPVAAEVEVDADGVRLAGDLAVPDGAAAVVMFAHGSGSSRHSPRNRSVASVLREAGLGTLLFDLLTPAEETDRANVFDIDTLSGRLLGATRWLRERESLPIGYFGASTGAAAALRAAADASAAADGAADAAMGLGLGVGAVVSRGGRPDLAAPRLGDVRAPTLLIVGGDDALVLDLNRAAQAELRCENRLEIVPGATHLFEEPGALDDVADLARDWFIGHLAALSAQGAGRVWAVSEGRGRLSAREPRLRCLCCPVFWEVAWWRRPLREGDSMPWFIWLLAAAALGAAEFFTLTLVFGLLAGAALVAAVVAGVGIGFLGQLVAFGVAAAAGLVIVRPIALRQMTQQPLSREGSDALIGKRAEVMEEVTATHGLIKLSGEEWSARTLDESLVIPVGALVDVMEIEGATAIVYPRELLP